MPCRFSKKSNITLKKKSQFLKGKDPLAARGMESFINFMIPTWKQQLKERVINHLDMSRNLPEFRHAVYTRIRKGELDNR